MSLLGKAASAHREKSEDIGAGYALISDVRQSGSSHAQGQDSRSGSGDCLRRWWPMVGEEAAGRLARCDV